MPNHFVTTCRNRVGTERTTNYDRPGGVKRFGRTQDEVGSHHTYVGGHLDEGYEEVTPKATTWTKLQLQMKGIDDCFDSRSDSSERSAKTKTCLKNMQVCWW